jgi:RNA polymerase sigma factor (sigma-70 family)
MPQPVLTDVLRHLGQVCRLPDGQALSDAELLRRFVTDREEAAFTMLVQRHGPLVLGVCRRVLGDADGADDSFQATFLVLARRADAIRKQESLASWLYGVALRIASRARNRMATQTAAGREWGRWSKPMRQTEPLDELTWQELRAVIDEEVGRLPEKFRVPVVLCYFQGKSHEQAARELGCPKRSLTSRVARARELLRIQLVRRGLALSAGALITALGEKAAAVPVGAMLTLNTVTAAVGKIAANAGRASSISPSAIELADHAIRCGIGLRAKLALMILVLALIAAGAGVAANRIDNEAAPELPAIAAIPATVARDGDKQDEPRPHKLEDAPLPPGALARLGTTRFRTAGGLYAMALAPDGQTAVSVSHVTEFWDLATGKTVRQLNFKQGGGGRVAAYSPDGRLVAWVQDHGGLRLWDTAAGKQLAEQALDMQFTSSLGFSPDGSLLATGGGQATYGASEKTKSNSVISLWHWDGTTLKQRWLATPDYEAPLGPRSHHISALAFSPDGKLLATGGGNNNIIRIWNSTDGKELRQFKASGGRVLALAFAPVAAGLASGSNDGSLTLWDPATGTKRWETGQVGEVRTVAFSPDGKTLVAGGGAEYGRSELKKTDAPFLVMLDAGTGTDARPLRIARNSVASVAFSTGRQGSRRRNGQHAAFLAWHHRQRTCRCQWS